MPTHAPYAQWTESTPLAITGGASSVSIYPPQKTFPNAGYNDGLTASALGADGFALATSFTWTSSDLSVATVSPTGYVQTVGAGMARIRATAASGAYAEAVVTVGVVALLKEDGEPWKPIQAMHAGEDLTEASEAYAYTGGAWVRFI